MTSIIILSYNNLDLTKKCIDAILLNTGGVDYEIVVVDNGSGAATQEWLRMHHKEGVVDKLYLSPINLGVPAGWNKGLEMADKKVGYYLVLNNDVFVTPGWLEKLIRTAEYHPKIGMVGPVSDNVSGPQGGGFVHRGGVQFWRLVGFCLLIKREVVEKVGLFDERFGRGNFEDDDYCVRVIEAGYVNMICGDCFVHHVGSASWEDGALNEQLTKNQKIFNDKWPAARLKELGIIG